MPYHTTNYHISQNPHTTSHNIPKRQWLLLKWLFWPKPWPYYHLTEFLKKILKILIPEFELFFCSSRGQKLNIHADLFSSWILRTIWLSHTLVLGHYQEESLTHLMLINAFIVFWLRGQWDFPNNKFFLNLKWIANRSTDTDWLVHWQIYEHKKVKI